MKLAVSLLIGQTKFWIPKSFKIIMFCTGNWYVGWRWWSMISAIYIYIQFINNRCWIRLLWYLSSVFKPNFTLWQYLNKQIYKLYIRKYLKNPSLIDGSRDHFYIMTLKMVEFGLTIRKKWWRIVVFDIQGLSQSMSGMEDQAFYGR